MIMEKTASLKLVAFLAVLFCFVNATKSTGVPKVKAVAYVISKWGPKGILHFKQEGDGPTTIRGKLYHLSPGAHGFHIHAYGDVAHFCQSTGDHFNPFHKDHGGPEDWFRHAGDLGNIYVGSDGEVVINIVDKHRLIPLVGPNSIIGRSVVVHDKNDDLGKVVGNRNSRKNGNAGDKIACGAIGLQA